ncbi:lasso peptide biosynthesis PqqD family chaperone [Streptomyces sp. NPDC090303]|uniref:lasso peptide biosynthesis PqqD family chaperone n=1 Tax=Streptomyces sp. NPDC090303 TaxID=3365960 RepID=UPI0037F45410
MALQLSPDVATVEVEDGAVLLNQRTGRYWQLNYSGAYTLRCILDGKSLAQTASEIAAHYGIKSEVARADVDAVVDQLQSSLLLEETP